MVNTFSYNTVVLKIKYLSQTKLEIHTMESFEK